MPHSFPAADNIETRVKFSNKSRYLFGVVLQVGIHGEDNFTFATFKSSCKCGRLAKVASETYRLSVGVLIRQFLHDRPGAVARTIVNKDDLRIK